MLVDPATPLLKLIRATLLGDTLQGANTNAVVE